MDKETPKQPEAAAAKKHTPAEAPMEPAAAPTTGGAKKKKGLIIGVVISVIVVAVGVGIGIWMYMQNTPDSLMKAAVENIGKEKALAANFTAINGTGQSATTLTGNVAWTTDSANANNGELMFNINANGSNIGVSLLSLGSNLYLKATGMQNLASLLASSEGMEVSEEMLAQYESILSMIDDQWLSVASSELQSVAGTNGASNVNNLPKQAELAKLAEIYGQNQFIVTDKVYSDEVIEGANCAHFSIKFDSAKYVAFLQAVKNANLSSFTVTDQNIADAKNNASPFANMSVEAWITRDTKKFKQIKLTDTSSSNPSTLTATFTSTLPSFDKFEVPAGAMTLNDLMLELMGANETEIMVQ